MTFGLFYTLESPGLTKCLNPYSLALPFLSAETDHGWSDSSEERWWKLDVPCQNCQKHVTYKSGIIYANFGHARANFRPCQGAWCASCFNLHELDRFEVAVPRDLNGASLAEVEDEVRYTRARPGDHVCTSFQCPNCHSQNIRGRDLVKGCMEDEAFEALAIRATLDAFWSSASKTVGDHVRNVSKVVTFLESLDIPNPFPRLGPFPRSHHLGMLEAIMVLTRGNEPGRTKGKDHVQWGTARKVKSAFSVIWDSSPESGADITLSSSSVRGRFVATVSPSEGRWYQRFTKGCCARMGDIVQQDWAYSIEVLHRLLQMYEAEWSDLQYDMDHNSMCSVMFLLLTCLGGMQGFEAVWTDLAALRYDVEFCEASDDYRAVSWPIVGRFKAQDGIAGCYMIPIAGKTDSGIQFFTWTQRFIGQLARCGLTEGWAFQRKDGTRACAADFKSNIFEKLEVIQSTTTLIDPACNIWEDFGVQRSGRRFFTTHTTIMGVPQHLIELQARWSTDRALGVRTV